MSKPSQGERYAPLSPKPERKPLSPKLFTNLLGQALARQGLDAALAPAIVQDLMAITPPSSLIPETFSMHGVELRWPAGREARVLYPDELRALNKALVRNNSTPITEDDAIVRVARGHYEALWNKRNQPDYEPHMPRHDAWKTSRVALSDTLSDALACVEDMPPADAPEHAHHWERTPGDIQDRCNVPGCGATQQSASSAIAGKTGQPIAPGLAQVLAPHRVTKTKSDVRPNPKPSPEPVIEHVTSGAQPMSALDQALAKLAATVDASTTQKKGATK
jgi:hypothetical protein